MNLVNSILHQTLSPGSSGPLLGAGVWSWVRHACGPGDPTSGQWVSPGWGHLLESSGQLVSECTKSDPNMPLGRPRGFWDMAHSGQTLVDAEGSRQENSNFHRYDKCPKTVLLTGAAEGFTQGMAFGWL